MMNSPPDERFTGLAEVYDRSRPDYPKEVLSFLESHCGLHDGSVIVDVGAGTGISSRWLGRKGWRVIGIEPNDDMRRQAESVALAPIRPVYHQGTGEATGLADGLADLIVCAQAFHWLKPDLALPEFLRVLKEGGWVALIWNERDNGDAFTADFGQIIRRNPESVRTEDARQRAWQAFMNYRDFDDKERIGFRHRQEMDEEGLIGRALSMSHVPREAGPREALVQELRECFSRWKDQEKVVMHYETAVFVGKKSGG